MKTSITTVQKLIITDVPNLDSISVYLEDQGPECGKITITCFNDSWSYYWGAMGNGYTISTFFISCDKYYLAGKLAPGLDSTEECLDDIVNYTRQRIRVQRRRDELSKEQARLHWSNASFLEGMDSRAIFDSYADIMYDLFGDEWWYCLPTKPNYRYEYLCRIINTVKDALQTL